MQPTWSLTYASQWGDDAGLGFAGEELFANYGDQWFKEGECEKGSGVNQAAGRWYTCLGMIYVYKLCCTGAM